MSAKVRYPAADGGDGHVVTIQDAASGAPYTCFGCGAPMVARQGTKRAWHFAHKPPLSECADPDRALHETAKAMILQGFTAALADRGEYRAGFCCQDCGTDAAWNIARPGSSITPEHAVVEGTRSDIVIDRATKGPLIIEVAVTHEIEEATRLRYEQSGLPVFVVHPQWDTITELAHTPWRNVSHQASAQFSGGEFSLLRGYTPFGRASVPHSASSLSGWRFHGAGVQFPYAALDAHTR